MREERAPGPRNPFHFLELISEIPLSEGSREKGPLPFWARGSEHRGRGWHTSDLTSWWAWRKAGWAGRKDGWARRKAGGLGERMGRLGEEMGGLGEGMDGLGKGMGGLGEGMSGLGEETGGLGERTGGLREETGGLGEGTGGLGEGMSALHVEEHRKPSPGLQSQLETLLLQDRTVGVSAPSAPAKQLSKIDC